MKKILLTILDGAAGRPCKTLGGKTSLEAAKTPVIDSLFHHSINGLMHVIGPNIAPQSDVAAFALLGYNPFNVPSRGIVEAIGGGVDYHEGEVAMRCNIAIVKGDKLVSVRLSNMTDEEGKEIERLINEGISLDVPFTFKHTKGYRGVLILHKHLPANVTNTHPGYIRERIGEELISVAKKLKEGMQIKECRPLTPEAKVTADIINDFTKQAQEVLVNAGMPANYIFIRGVGNHLPKLKSFEEMHGFKMAMVAAMPVELGIAKIVGMDTIPEYEDYSKLVNEVINASHKYKGIYVHIKGPDKYGHLGDAHGKVRAIERIDKEFMGPLMKAINLDDYTVCVTSDHATPAVYGSHSSDPVPYLITNGGKAEGHFYEGTVSRTFIEGRELMNKIIKEAKSGN